MPELKSLRRVFHQWGGTTATLFSYAHFSHDLSTGLLAALLPLIRESLGLSYLQSGILLSAYAITSGLSNFLGGWIGDRANRQLAMAIGLGGVGLGALAVGLSTAYYAMLIILVMMGIFAGAYHPSGVSLLTSHVEVARRGKALALHMVGGSIGFFIGPVLGGLIAATMGWSFAFIFLCIPALVSVPLVLTKVKQQKRASDGELISQAPAKSDTADTPRRKRLSLWQALRPVAIITILAILMQIIEGCATAYMPLYLVDKHNIAPAYAAMMIGIIRAGGIAGSLLGGWLSDKWGRRNAIFLALVATGPTIFLLTKLSFNSAFIAIMVLFGLLMLMRGSTVQPFLMDNIPIEFRATAIGIYFGLGMEGQSLIQPVAGYFMDILGIAQVFNVIALISVALSIGILLLATIPKLRR